MTKDKVQVIDADSSCPALPLVEGEGEARAVIWPGVGAALRSMHVILLGPGSRTIEMQHPMEAVYYVRSGTVTACDFADDSGQEAETGSMIFVEPETAYRLSADEGSAELLGGPCPPDLALYEHLDW